MLVEVNWTLLTAHADDLWNVQLCLYAYLHPLRDWLLYVGKADHSTIRERLHGADKRLLFRAIRRRYDTKPAELRVLHGELRVEPGTRRSSALLADTESLLIKRLRPFGNIQSRHSRISRPGLRVHCLGDWPFRRSGFIDIED